MKAVIVADTSAYSAGLTKAGTQAQAFERKSTKSMGKVGAVAKTMGKTGALALGAGLAVGIKKSVDAFREQQKVSRQTDAVLRSTGKAAGMSKKAIEDLATALSKKTGIDDEAVQSTENLLLTFTKIGKKSGVFKQATALALDMSTALGVDARSAAMQLGKALQDPVKGATALARSGVDKAAIEHAKALAKSGKQLEAQKYLLREVAKEVGGSAAAVATPMDHLMVTLDSLGEKIGGVVVPWLDKGASALNNFLNGAMSGNGGGIGEFLSNQFSTLSENLKASGFGDVIERIKANFSNLWALVKQAASGIGQAFSSVFGKGSGVGVDIANIVTQIGKVYAVVQKVEIAIVKRALPGIISAFKGFATIIRGVIRVISGVLSGDFGKAWDGVKDIFKGAIKALGGIIRAATAPFREAGSRIGKGLLSGIKSAISAVGDIGKSIANAIIGLLNSAIPNKIPLPGRLPDIDLPDNPIPRFAKGGYVGKSPMQLVGEKGPELVSLPAGSYVHNASKTRAMLGNGMTVPAFANGGRVQNMLGRAKAISNKHMPYQYGGYGNPSYDCSGYWSAIMNAGGYNWGRLTTVSFRSKLASGKGKNVTIGIRGGAGKTGHMMGAIRDGNRWRYFEAGGRGPVGEYGGWNGSFNWYHPKDDASLDPATLKAGFSSKGALATAFGDPSKDNRAGSSAQSGLGAGWAQSTYSPPLGSIGGGSGTGGTGGEGGDAGGSVGDLVSVIQQLVEALQKADTTRNIVRGEIEQSVLDFFNKGIGGRLAGGSRMASAGVSY